MKLLVYFQTSVIDNDKLFHLTFYWAYDYLSMLEIKLIHVHKMGPRWIGKFNMVGDKAHLQPELKLMWSRGFCV